MGDRHALKKASTDLNEISTCHVTTWGSLYAYAFNYTSVILITSAVPQESLMDIKLDKRGKSKCYFSPLIALNQSP